MSHFLAKQASNAVLKGSKVTVKRVRTSTRFKRPNTRRRRPAPYLDRRGFFRQPMLNEHNVLLAPVNNEAALAKIESEHTLIFYVAPSATKRIIKDTVRKLYSVKVDKVRTLNTSTGKKKAFIKLAADEDPMRIAAKINLLV